MIEQFRAAGSTYYRPIDGVRYLDEIQDEAYARSSLHGDALVEADSRIPVRSARAEMLPGASFSGGKPPTPERLSLSGTWRMRAGEPADPGDPPPATGWFGRKAKDAEGMAKRWYEPGTDRGDWYEVTVPTTVQKALVGLGLMKDPFWNTNMIDELEEYGEPKELPVWFRRTRTERTDWWFAKAFELPEAWRGRRLTLCFDGIDYAGTVFVNGVSLGHHSGMFGGPELDISGVARFGEPNELVVRIDPAPQSWNGLLKGSPGFGWHYGHLISLGIWKEVSVQAEADIAILDPYVVTQRIGPDGAKLYLEYTLDSRLAEPITVVVEGVIAAEAEAAPKPDGGTLRFRTELRVDYGRHKFRTEVTLPKPALWWPAGYGEQPLYVLTLTGTPDRPALLTGGSVRFGVRTIEMRPARAAAPETDYRWQFVINGVPMFIKGANWCWPDPMLEQREDLYERLLELARRGHVQMLRAWGGGLVEGEVFYRKCDEKGILVYQEFPLCWGPPDSPHTDLGVIDRQVTRSVKSLRNHPSLIMWGGGNENGPHGGADEGLFLAGRRCRGFDPSRPFHRTDPWGGSVHNWHVYHGGEPLDAATRAMPSVFYGEFGIPSMTNRSSCLRYMPEEEFEAFPPTEESRGWKAHFHQFGLKDIIKVMRYGAFGSITDWDDYIAYSQTAQGEAIRFTADLQRAGAGSDKTGFWYYKFSDLFPGHSWGVVDFYGTPKLSYYRAKQACRPRHAFATFERIEGWKAEETFRAELHAANDTLEALENARISAVLYGSGLTAWRSFRYEGINISAGAVLHIGTLDMRLPSGEEISPFLLGVTLRAKDNTWLSDQWYWFNAQPKGGELIAFERGHIHGGNEYPGEEAQRAFELYASLPEAPLRRLPQTKLEWSIVRQGRKGGFRITNVGELPAMRVTIEGFPEAWDCFLDDNDFGLFPGEERWIPFEAGSGCALDQITVRAWNAPRSQAAKGSG